MMVERDYAACLIGAAACWMELLLLLDVMAALMVIAYIPINRCCLKSIDSSGSSQLYIYMIVAAVCVYNMMQQGMWKGSKVGRKVGEGGGPRLPATPCLSKFCIRCCNRSTTTRRMI